MCSYRGAINLLVILCLLSMPVVAHAHQQAGIFTTATEQGGEKPALMADCPIMKGMLAQQGDTDHKGATTDGCATESCYLKCFHSPDLSAAPMPVRFVVRSYEVGQLFAPASLAYAPPTPPPQG
jgi:hypothetical protein